MSLFGGFGGLLEAAIGAHPGGVSGVLGNVFSEIGGLDGVVAKLNQSGLGEKVNSWAGHSANTPISASEITAALGNQQLKQVAAKLGVPLDQVAGVLAHDLPTAVGQP